jgi:glucose/arabinose dehydrogenase
MIPPNDSLMRAIAFPVMILLVATVATSGRAAEPVVIDGDVPAEGGFRSVTLLQGLEHPWSMAWLPNGDLLVTERPGRLRLVKGGRLVAAPVDGVPDVFAAGQGGLLDVSLHPRFSENRRIYFSYAHGSAKTNHTRVAVAEFDGDRLDSWTVIFQVGVHKSGKQHFGSRLLWLPDESLLVSIGDGGNPPVRLAGDWIRKQAQNKRSHLGKILRLDDTGHASQGNPFSDMADAEKTIWSYGHRNIQGLAYDSLRKMVWASEHGALGGDELNRIQKAGNYGWPVATYSREYVGGFKISDHVSKARHGESAGGLDDGHCTLWTDGVHRRPISRWHGDIFVGGLRSQDIRRIDVDDSGRVMAQTALRIGHRVRDVRQGPDGLIYVLTDETDGHLIRLEPAEDDQSPPSP